MLRNIILVLAAAVTVVACGKDNNPGSQESILHGTWSKGTNYGDTMWFYKNSNGKNIMFSRMSFNPLAPANAETEYTFQDNKLTRMGFMGMTKEILSFKWKQQATEFEVSAPEIYPFMATAFGPYVVYKKIQ